VNRNHPNRETSHLTTKRNSRRIAAWVLFAAGVVGWGWGIACFFEPLIWERGLNTIAVGILLWLLALGAAEDYPRIFVWAGRAVERLGGILSVDLYTPERRFAALGLLTFAVPAGMLVQQYLYLFKFLGAQIALVAAVAAAGGLISLLVCRGLTGLAARFFPQSEWRRTAGIWGAYGLAWAAALHFLFPDWQALGTDPIVRQFLISLAAALVLVWLFFGRLKGPAGRVHRPAAVAAVVLALASAGLDYSSAVSHDAPPRLRVLLLTLDTTRADYLSIYGYPRETSPNLDALARSGARFARCFSPAGLTDPSHASIMTGTYPRTHGLNNNHQSIVGNVPSMPEVFYDRGFTTGAVVAREHVLPVNLNVPGFADQSGVTSWLTKTDAHETYRRAANYILKNRDRDLFVWVHFFDPHGPYEPHPGISDQFIDKNRGKRGGRRVLKPGQTYSEKEIKYRRDLYAGEIFYMDYYLGKLFDLVENLEPKAEFPALILVTADHGEFMGEYLDHPAKIGFGHGPVFNPGVHIPLIIKYPGFIPAGKVVNEVAESVDIAPTLLDYALGYASYPGQGFSLRPLIEGTATGDRFAFIRGEGGAYSRWSPLYAVIKNNYKLMISVDADGELFDLDSDWEEKKDLRAERPQVADELTVDYRLWENRTPQTVVKERELTPAEKKTLRALGYID